MSIGDTDELTARIDRLEHEIAKLRSERETALMGWPNEPTVAQGFMAGRWQRRDGDGYTQALVNIPEAPYDNNYYGRYQYTWQPVVEEAPAATTRRSTYGWARASAGSDITWISLDDILANFVTEVPIGAAAYARVRLNDGDTGWTDISQLYLPRAGGQMTGPLIAATGTGLTNPGLAIGDNATGFWRSGNVVVTSVSGAFVQQWLADMVQMAVPIMMGGQKITSLDDATAPQDALNLRTADARYGGALQTTGGQMTGDISMVGTTGPTVMAKLNLYVRGASLAWSETDNAIVFTKGTGNYPLVVRANDGSNPQPILDQTLGDARYLQLTQVDSLRAKPVIYNIPADIVIPGSGDWTQIANIPCTLPPRPGVTSMLMVSVNCNLKGVNNVAGIGARVPISPTPEQRIFGFGGTATDPSAGFSVNFFVTPAAGVTTLNVAVQLNAFPITGGSPVSYTVAGGNVLVLDRSQIVIVDLGPT
jgi:hypothetical protein